MEAMARAFVAAHREPVAVVVSSNGRVERFYRNDDFPFLPIATGKPLPPYAIAAELRPSGDVSDEEEVEPDTWFAERDANRTLALSEQVLGRSNGYAMTLLQTELDEDE